MSIKSLPPGYTPALKIIRSLTELSLSLSQAKDLCPTIYLINQIVKFYDDNNNTEIIIDFAEKLKTISLKEFRYFGAFLLGTSKEAIKYINEINLKDQFIPIIKNYIYYVQEQNPELPIHQDYFSNDSFEKYKELKTWMYDNKEENNFSLILYPFTRALYILNFYNVDLFITLLNKYTEIGFAIKQDSSLASLNEFNNTEGPILFEETKQFKDIIPHDIVPLGICSFLFRVINGEIFTAVPFSVFFNFVNLRETQNEIKIIGPQKGKIIYFIYKLSNFIYPKEKKEEWINKMLDNFKIPFSTYRSHKTGIANPNSPYYDKNFEKNIEIAIKDWENKGTIFDKNFF